MRCVLRPVTRILRYAPAIVLLLTAAPPAASAQPLVCHEIRRGESAIQAARRVTGDSRNAYQDWFQIRNASSRFVPKSQYNRVRAGWEACVRRHIQRASARVEADAAVSRADAPGTAATSMAPDAVSIAGIAAHPAVLVAGGHADEAGETSSSAASRILRAIARRDLTMLWLGAAMVVPWMGWRLLDDRLARNRTATIVMRQFATRFVQEFERPLMWSDADRPIRARVRYSAWRGRLEILLTPGNGRRYPNLADHKKNVEYDVARVMRAMGDPCFVNGRPYTQAGWVVVPLQFKSDPRQSGVTCISSL
jgi:hypothetical protein